MDNRTPGDSIGLRGAVLSLGRVAKLKGELVCARDNLVVPADLADDLVKICACGDAAWTGAAFGFLGGRWTQTNGLGWGRSALHPYLLGAITLESHPDLPDELHGTVRDSWSSLSTELGSTRRPEPADPWMLRAPGRCIAPEVAGVHVGHTTDAEEFERVAFLAASGTPPRRVGELHPRGSETTPGLHLLLAFRGERPVGTALAMTHSIGVLISAVAVVTNERRLGIGAALTAAAVNCAPDRPATLSASRIGANTYRRLGFTDVGAPTDWHLRSQ